MPRALEVIAGRTVAAGATITEVTMNTGNSATIRNTPLDALIQLLQLWTVVQAVGTGRVRSPKLHDNVNGIRVDNVADNPRPLLPNYHRQKLYPQDELTIELSGSAVAGDVDMIALLIGYDDLPGISGRFITEETLYLQGVNTLTVENTITTGATGDWSGEEALNAEFDLLKANTDYALVGYLVDTQCGSVRWRGSDFGNLGVGGVGDDMGRDYTASWFLNLARYFGAPWIPVFNSANKDAVLVDAHQDEDAASVTLTSILVELAPGAAPAA